VAAAILERTGTVATSKLQKLLYYAQSWHLVFNNKKIFSDRIEAAAQGPVVPDLQRRHKRFEVAQWNSGNPSRLSGSERETVDWVVRQYGEFSAEALSNMTRMEMSAGMAYVDHGRSSEEIDLRQMASYYSRQRSSPAVAVSQVVASTALEGISLDDEWQEKLWEVASGEVPADEVIAEEIRRARDA
jgi:uncharacterized phage-associated protein